VKDNLATRSAPSHVGLCLDCLHVKRVEGKEDTFYFLCELSFANHSFPKYPRRFFGVRVMLSVAESGMTSCYQLAFGRADS
jgi:hypothetical protein